MTHLAWFLLLQGLPDPVLPQDLDRFPEQDVAQKQMRLYWELKDLLEFRVGIHPTDRNLPVLLQRTERCLDCWRELYYLHLYHTTDHYRIQGLTTLKTLLGPDSYRTGRMPFFPSSWLLELPRK